MADIFRYKSQKRIFIALIAAFLLTLGYSFRAASFEKDWYDLEYKDYMKHPEEYSVTQAEIIDTRTYSGSNDRELTLLDFYQAAIVRVEFADGRSEVFRTSRRSSEKTGDKIGVCYDVRYDSGWSPDKTEVPEGTYLNIPRNAPVNNHTVSNLAKTLAVIFAAAAGGYAFVCRRKNS